MSAGNRAGDTGRADGLRDAALAAAVTVVNNALGTSPRHSAQYGGSHRDDCIPCGISALRQALIDLGVPGVLR